MKKIKKTLSLVLMVTILCAMFPSAVFCKTEPEINVIDEADHMILDAVDEERSENELIEDEGKETESESTEKADAQEEQGTPVITEPLTEKKEEDVSETQDGQEGSVLTDASEGQEDSVPSDTWSEQDDLTSQELLIEEAEHGKSGGNLDSESEDGSAELNEVTPSDKENGQEKDPGKEELSEVSITEEPVTEEARSADTIQGSLSFGCTRVSVSGTNTVYYSFSPRNSANYVIFSSADKDTYGYLYDSSWNFILSNDDGGEEHNFRLSSYLAAYETYYIGVRFYSDSVSGSIPVILVKDGIVDSLEGQNEETVSSGETVYCAFKPRQTAHYSVFSTSGSDTYGYVYDGDWNLIASNDDGGEGHNFKLSFNCNAISSETVYYVGIRYYSDYNSGTIPFTIAQTASLAGNADYCPAGQYALFSFTPTENGSYEFYTDRDQDTVGYLYDANWNYIDSDDNSGINKNFYLKRFLYAGTTYLIKVIESNNNTKDYIIFLYLEQLSGTCGDQVSWSVENGNTLKFSGSGSIGDYTETPYDQPWYAISYSITRVEVGEGVTRIGNAALWDFIHLSSVSLPGTLTSIGDRAFANCGISSLKIPKGVTKIGSGAFDGCSGLVISGYSDSAAERYAKENGIQFKCLDKKSLSNATVTVSARTFTGKALTPVPVVKLGTVTLEKGTHYKVTYKNNINAGKATVTVTGIGSYIGSKTSYFTIKAAPISKAAITIASKTYTGKALTPAPKVKLGTVTLKKGTHYTVSYKNNKNAGKGTVTITGKGNLSGKITKSFTIAKASPALKFASASLTKERNSKAFTNKLTKTTDGKISYSSSNKKVASVNSKTGKVTIKGKGTSTITVKSAAGKNYKSGKKSYKLTVLKAGAFRWNRDNWNFNNNTFYFPTSRYIDQINSSYISKLVSNLSNSEYQRIFSWMNGLIYRQWEGSCYGMTVLELLSKEKMLPYASYKSGATKLVQLNAPKKDRNVSSLITYYQMLQYKDVIQQTYMTSSRKSNKESIKRIISLLDKKSTVAVCFNTGDSGHAILACDYKYGSFKWNGNTYQGRIQICDPNSSTWYDERYDLYFKTSDYKWIIPAYPDTAYYGNIDLVEADKSLLNNGGYLGGTSKSMGADYIARLDMKAVSNQHSVTKVQKKNGDYITKNSTLGDIEKADRFTYGSSQEKIEGYNLYDPNSSFKVTQEKAGEINLTLKYEDCYLEAGSDVGNSIVFDRSGAVSLEGNSADYRLAMTFDNDYPTDWFTVEVSGKNAGKISLRKAADGYIVTGNKLKNVTVRVNNKERSETKTFSANVKKACICQTSGGALDVRIDQDLDEVFETSLFKNGQ